MNIILLAPEDWLDESTVRLDDRRHVQIRDVLKAEMGDALRVGLLGGLRGSGTVIKLCDEHTHLQVDLVDPPLPRHPCDLILALPRPKMLKNGFGGWHMLLLVAGKRILCAVARGDAMTRAMATTLSSDGTRVTRGCAAAVSRWRSV